MAANAPTWNWSADYLTCTATFTCTENTSLTATVNATVTESNGSKTATVRFNGTAYSDTKNTTCTVTWKNYDGTTLKTDTVNSGSTPSYTGATPTKEGNAQYSYTFSGWSPVVSAVTSDTTYTAQFTQTVNKYTVTWKNGDTTLETDTNVTYGATPTYNGATPTKANEDKYSYTFKEWSPAISIVTGDVTYTATYTKIPNSDHFSHNGDTYTIHDVTGWEIFCDLLAENPKGYFTGKTVLLGDDISVTRMAGGSQHDFTGTFDGQGHTLTVTFGTSSDPVSDDDKAAPFRNAESGCIIKNLHTEGTIYTSKKYASGIIGTQFGTVRIENCRSSVTIISSTAGDGTHGGFVGRNGRSSYAILTIDGCTFDGKILSAGTTPTTECAGFVGYKDDGTVTISNSIYAPAALEPGETEVASGATFVRNGSAGTNCYYTRALGSTENQGKLPRSITAAQDVTLDLSGEKTVCSVSGITAYTDNSGLKYGDTIYAANEETVTLTLAHNTPTGCSAAFTANAGELNGNTLTMPNNDVVISAIITQNDYSITTNAERC